MIVRVYPHSNSVDSKDTEAIVYNDEVAEFINKCLSELKHLSSFDGSGINVSDGTMQFSNYKSTINTSRQSEYFEKGSTNTDNHAGAFVYGRFMYK